MIGKVWAATAAGWLALAPSAWAADAKAELMAVDRSFSALSARGGAAAAFRDTMDPVDGLSFDAGRDPARGTAAVQALTQKNVGAGKLTWAPADAFVSRGADMGATWGHWRFDVPVAGAKPVTGRYVTVWRKDAAGAWKGLIDIGTPD